MRLPGSLTEPGSCSRMKPTGSTCATWASPTSTGRAASSASSRNLRTLSEYAVTGVYFYDETVWKVLSELQPSRRGELEITDVNNWYLDHGLIEYDVIEGFWGDAGESMQAYYEVQDFVREHGVNQET